MKLSTQGPPLLVLAQALLSLSMGWASNVAVADSPVVHESQNLPAQSPGGYGYTVSVDGDTALVGAAVFTRDDSGVWSKQTELMGSDIGVGARDWGSRVAVDGDTAVIGHTYASTNVIDYAGAVYVFTRDASGMWSEQAKLVADDATYQAYLGDWVAVDGDTVVSSTYSEQVYIFTRSAGGLWSQQAKLYPPDMAENFGSSVAVDGDTALIGASFTGRNGIRYCGAAYVFVRDVSGVWSEQAVLGASDAAEGDFFGEPVALDGDTALIGASGENSHGLEDNGAAYVFTRDASGAWSENAKLLASDSASQLHFGINVDLDGATALIGAPGDDFYLPGYSRQAAYLFTQNESGTWSERAKLLSSDAEYQYRVPFVPLGLSQGTAIWYAWEDGPAYVFDVSPFTNVVLDVGVDIKPGNERNAINPRSKGKFWVAILSDKDFDSLQVDAETVALGPAAAHPDRYKVKDANADRIPDLVLRFKTPTVGIRCSDSELELAAETYGGASVTGTDGVKTVGCKKPTKGKKN